MQVQHLFGPPGSCCCCCCGSCYAVCVDRFGVFVVSSVSKAVIGRQVTFVPDLFHWFATPSVFTLFLLAVVVVAHVAAITCLLTPSHCPQQKEIDAFKHSDELPLPADVNYREALPSISAEEAELLGRVKPVSVHAARRIAGIRPSTLIMLYQLARRLAKNQARAQHKKSLTEAAAEILA